MKRTWPAIGAILLAAAPVLALDAKFPPAETLPGADLFTNGAVWSLSIEIPAAAIESLRREPRDFVRATLRENGTVYENVAIHLKGSIGSFREVDDKPDLTLDFNRFNAGHKFHGLRRIHLNNSVEDPAYCNELLGGELFRAAGIPAPRVTHAVVTFNGRRLGLYVLLEGFTEDFLGCYFARIGGNLYEPGEGHDVNQSLKNNSILAPKEDSSALAALAQSALETDPARRWARLQQTLNVNEFVDFMAMEVMVGHRDGYSLARNNYRVYCDVDSDRIVFFPHGMDQLFGNPNATWLPHMAGVVARAVMETPEGRRQYRERFGALFTNVFHAQALQGRVNEIIDGLRPALSGAEFDGVQEAAARVKERIARRQLSLQRQLAEPEPQLLAFTNGIGHPGDWAKVDDSACVMMDEGEAPDHTMALHITARSNSGASWRTDALLPRGHYRFEGQARVAGVKPLPFGNYQGAGLRVGGNFRDSGNLVGNCDWRALSAAFDVTEDAQEVELVCELRANAGEAWFGVDSLRIVKVP